MKGTNSNIRKKMCTRDRRESGRETYYKKKKLRMNKRRQEKKGKGKADQK